MYIFAYTDCLQYDFYTNGISSENVVYMLPVLCVLSFLEYIFYMVLLVFW